MSKPIPGYNIVGPFDFGSRRGWQHWECDERAKFARSLACYTSERGAPFTTAGFARVLERVGKVAKLAFKAHPQCSGTQLRMRAKSGVL